MLTNSQRPFGGSRIVLLGDWAQIPPVIKGGSRPSIVDASFKKSALWNSFTSMHLTQPICNASDPHFATWVDSLADNEDPLHVPIPTDLIHTCTDREDIIDFVFPTPILSNPFQASMRSIICPLNIQVTEYNNRILSQLEGEERIYYSTDSVVEDNVDANDNPMADIDHLNSMHLPGIPDHELHLKVNCICVLTCNFNIEKNLTKNTKVVITELGNRVIVAKLLQPSPHSNDNTILLPRIDFLHFLPHEGWTVRRRQFPLRLAYASTINSAQGLTLARIGIDCTHPVFTHGQLYTAFSRVPHASNCLIRTPPSATSIVNIVYSELL